MTDLPGIHNWFRIDGRTTTSGQPTEDELADIAALGVRRVVNLGLHTHERALRDEEASVAALGMIYTHIPVVFDAPAETDFKAFCRTLDDAADRPIHVHCIANYRVSAMFYRYRREVLGADAGHARADLLAIWTPDPVWSDFIRLDPS